MEQQRIGMFMENSINRWTNAVNNFLEYYENGELTKKKIDDFTSSLEKVEQEEFLEELKMVIDCDLDDLPD